MRIFLDFNVSHLSICSSCYLVFSLICVHLISNGPFTIIFYVLHNIMLMTESSVLHLFWDYYMACDKRFFA